MAFVTTRTASLVAVIVALTVPCYFITSRRADPRIRRHGQEDPGAEDNLPKRGNYKKVVTQNHLKTDDGTGEDNIDPSSAALPEANDATAASGGASLAELNAEAGPFNDDDDEEDGDPVLDDDEEDDTLLENTDPGDDGNLEESVVEDDNDGEQETQVTDDDEEDDSSLAEVHVTEEDTKKWRPTFNYLAKGGQNIKLDDYMKWQAGSLSSLVQSKVRIQAEKFADDGMLDLQAFTEMKKADENHEKVVNEAMFESFDHDHDGRVAVADLVQWTKEDAASHGVTLTDDQEKMFKDQYLHYSQGEDTMDFKAFTETGLAKVIVQSKMAAEAPPTPQ